MVEAGDFAHTPWMARLAQSRKVWREGVGPAGIRPQLRAFSPCFGIRYSARGARSESAGLAPQ